LLLIEKNLASEARGKVSREQEKLLRKRCAVETVSVSAAKAKEALLGSGTWSLDPEQTVIRVKAKTFFVFPVKGTMKLVSGQVQIGESLEDVQVDARIDAASYDSGSKMRDKHICSDSFFDVENHPEFHFSGSGVTESLESWELAGELTVREAASVSLSLSFPPEADDALTADITAVPFLAVATVDRKALGVGSMPHIPKKVTIEIETVARRS